MIPSIQQTYSSKKRREMMEKVENMVASIEEQTGVGVGVGVGGVNMRLNVSANLNEGQRYEDEDVLKMNIGNSRHVFNHGDVDADADDIDLDLDLDSSDEYDGDEESPQYDYNYDRARDLEASIHVSDVSTSEDEDEEDERERERALSTKSAAATAGLDVSQVYSSGSEDTLESLFGSPDELPRSRPAMQEPMINSYSHAIDSNVGLDDTTHTHTQIHAAMPTPAPVPIPIRSLMMDMDMEKIPIPQDRSVASKISTSGCSKSSKLSHLSAATPMQPSGRLSQPISSPPFALLSPPARAGAGVGAARTAGTEKDNNHTPLTDTKIYVKKYGYRHGNEDGHEYGSNTSTGTGTGTGTGIPSPPRTNRKTVYPKSASKVGTRMRTQRSKSTPLYHMKKEIQDLTAQFAALEKKSKQRWQSHTHPQPRPRPQPQSQHFSSRNNESTIGHDYLDHRFDESVNLMGQKANAMADALHRNYVRSDHLHRENEVLRRQMQNMNRGTNMSTSTSTSTSTSKRMYSTNTGTQRHKYNNAFPFGNSNENEHAGNYQMRHNRTNTGMGNQRPAETESYIREKTNRNNSTRTSTRTVATPKSSECLLRELESSDDYVKRQYPSVPKTPGTMFTTEFVEVLGLDTGEHAYLAEVMDRQWRTSMDYRP